MRGITARASGAHIAAIATQLAQFYVLSGERLAEMLADLFGVQIVIIAITGGIRSYAKRFAGL